MIKLCLLFFSITFLMSLASEGQAADLPKKKIIMETTLGTIKIKLFDEKAPISAANFRKYVQTSFFDGLIFHRVIPGFMIQGGGFEPGMKTRKPTQPEIINEATNGLKNTRGSLSMARTSVVNSATSQFFINVNDNSNLDHRGEAPSAFGYAVFGEVVEGMSVVDKIISSPTTSVSYYSNVPRKDIVIIKCYEE
jgi:cyclophilin family peptidyl-prolyl cis-trans isomerase